MNEIEFRLWLEKSGTEKKVASDTVSRAKRVERECKPIDFDEIYNQGSADEFLKIMSNKHMKLFAEAYPEANLPIGKMSIASYRTAVKKYFSFLESDK